MAQGCSEAEVILGSLLEHSLPPVVLGSIQLHVGSSLLCLPFHTWVLVQRRNEEQGLVHDGTGLALQGSWVGDAWSKQQSTGGRGRS